MPEGGLMVDNTKYLIDIQRRVEGVTGQSLQCAVTWIQEGEGLDVHLNHQKATIRTQDVNACARGLFLLSLAQKENRETLEVSESRHFESCGAMLDMSRNGVMTMEACKRYIDRMACLGLNMLMLYTEDTYEVPEYPVFGYLRGRFSQEEMKELDQYASSIGVEMIPCIQTLAHLRQFLRWPSSAPLRDQMDILLIDEEKTYDLIEAMIRSLRACFASKRIHIGMDEAMGVGLGAYMKKHGWTDRFELLNRHLNRVVRLCEDYDFHAIMWSDMYFRLGSPTNEYYDPSNHLPESVLKSLPDVGMAYWDYYHTDASMYDRMITCHEAMGPETVFAGGVWTWSGFLPNVRMTEDSMVPALKVCAEHNVRMVFATMWGDDGQETNHFLALPQLALFSEACWEGPEYSMEKVVAYGEFVSGIDRVMLEAFRMFFPDRPYGYGWKTLIWGDLLYPIVPLHNTTPDVVLLRAEKALSILENLPDSLEKEYTRNVFLVVRQRASIMMSLRQKYLEGDRAYLSAFAEEMLPRLDQAYHSLMLVHRRIWERDYRRQGWENLALRYGALRGRIEDVQDEVRRYLAGELPSIVELDETPLPAETYGWNYYTLSSPGASPV